MNIVQISKENQENAFAILAAVLWLGNIEFSVIDDEDHVEVVSNEGIALFNFVLRTICLFLCMCLHGAGNALVCMHAMAMLTEDGYLLLFFERRCWIFTV